MKLVNVTTGNHLMLLLKGGTRTSYARYSHVFEPGIFRKRSRCPVPLLPHTVISCPFDTTYCDVLSLCYHILLCPVPLLPHTVMRTKILCPIYFSFHFWAGGQFLCRPYHSDVLWAPHICTFSGHQGVFRGINDP